MRCLWTRGVRDMEVLRAEVDMGGYDLVLESNRVLRYVQLKASHRGAATSSVQVNVRLEQKPGGCVVWMRFDPATLRLGPFWWFGGPPGEQMPSLGTKLGRHAKGNKNGIKSVRPNIRILPLARFARLSDIDAVTHELFYASSVASPI